jgi:hypothetical protein
MIRILGSTISRVGRFAGLRLLLLPGLFAMCGQLAQAQWTPSGNNIYNSNSGHVGVGTATPTQKLDVNGAINAAGTIYSVGSFASYVAWDRTSSGAAVFYRLDTITRLRDSVAGDIISYNTSGNVGIGTNFTVIQTSHCW